MKKIPSQRFLQQLATKLAAKPSEMLELFGVSRSYLYKLSLGERPLTGQMLEKAAAFAMKESALKSKAPSAAHKNLQASGTISKADCARNAARVWKKIKDLQLAMQHLQKTEEAIEYVSQMCDQFEPKSKEHDWCVLHLRRLKHRMPKNPELQRTEWEAKLAGLEAEKKYWEKVKK